MSAINTIDQDYDRNYVFGDFTLHANGVLLHKQKRVSIPPKELKVLTVLLEHAGQLVSKDHLLETVWASEEASEESLTRCIYALRKILLETKDKKYIETAYGRGYRLNHAVASVSQNKTAQRPKCKIAVLPFQMENQAQTLHIHDHLIQCLSRYSPFGLTVLPAIMTQNCVRAEDVLDLIQRFTPDYYIAGQLFTSNNKNVLRTELVRAQDHALLHRENIEINNDADLARLQRRLINILQHALPEMQLNQKEPVSLGSFDAVVAYLNGKYEFSTYTPQSLKRALTLFRQCVQNSPGHVMSWCTLAETYLALTTLGLLEQDMALHEAELAVNRALHYEPDNPLALALLATISLHHEPLAADAIFRQIELLSPEMAEIRYYYALHLFSSGKLNEALQQINLSIEYDPSRVNTWILKIWIKFYLDDLKGAISLAKQQLNQQTPNHPILQIILAILLSESNDHTAAVTLAKLAVEQSEQAKFIHINYAYVLSNTDQKTADSMLDSFHNAQDDYLVYAALLPLVNKLQGTDSSIKLYQDFAQKKCYGLQAVLSDPRLYELRKALNQLSK
jgi:DNA-binding winged helix-turn-helix (wHTH) protein/Tfp pilus assembly protein PilF